MSSISPTKRKHSIIIVDEKESNKQQKIEEKVIFTLEEFSEIDKFDVSDDDDDDDMDEEGEDDAPDEEIIIHDDKRKYKILKKIGDGIDKNVFKVSEVNSNKKYALLQLRDKPKKINKYKKEVMLNNKLSQCNPQLCPHIYDHWITKPPIDEKNPLTEEEEVEDQDEEEAFIVQELFDGNLNQYYTSNRPSNEDKRVIANKVIEMVIQAIHIGISVLADLKPENVLFKYQKDTRKIGLLVFCDTTMFETIKEEKDRTRILHLIKHNYIYPGEKSSRLFDEIRKDFINAPPMFVVRRYPLLIERSLAYIGNTK